MRPLSPTAALSPDLPKSLQRGSHGTASPPAAQRFGVSRLQEVHPQQQRAAQQQQSHEGQQHQAAHQEGVHDLRAERTVTASIPLQPGEKRDCGRMLHQEETSGLPRIVLGHKTFRCGKGSEEGSCREAASSISLSVLREASAHTAPRCRTEGLLQTLWWLLQHVSLFNEPISTASLQRAQIMYYV